MTEPIKNIASVVLSGATREYDKQYHYLIPESLVGKALPGVRAIVPFGGGNISREGYIVSVSENSDYANLKIIKRVIDTSPVLSEKMMKLALWMRERYICSYPDSLKCMLPAGTAVKSHRLVKLSGKPIESSSQKKISKTAEKILVCLNDCGGELDQTELAVKLSLKSLSAALRELANLDLIEVREAYSEAVRDKFIRAACLAVSQEEITEEIAAGRFRSIMQIRALEMLSEHGEIAVSELKRFTGISAASLNSLEKNNFIVCRDIEVIRDPYINRVFQRTPALKPTSEQTDVLESLKAKLDEIEFHEALLKGVTGSGKTEVYMQLITHSLQSGRQAIMLVPEISLTPQMVERFKQRFGDNVAVQHSRLSLGERYDQWQLIKQKKVQVVVGARSAVFAPFENLGIIIIDEEHESSYKSESTPKYHAADIARQRCKEDRAMLLCGSATPSVETFYKAETKKIALYQLHERTNKMNLPNVVTVDMRKELDIGNRSIFSVLLANEIRENLAKGEQTILFLNRRGYASFVICRSCGYTVKCRQCSISMTYHAKNERLICHHCGNTEKTPTECPKCGSKYIRHFGTGTQKVEEEIKKEFPSASVLRMDMDTTGGKNAHEDILRAFREDNIDILVGTQMIAKGHDFPKVTLVGVLAADSLLGMGDYRASERTFQLLTQVAGRAGRDVLPGRVVIQTYNTDDFSIQAACRYDYEAFYRQEIAMRKQLLYPPFTDIGVVTVSSCNDRLAYDKAKDATDKLKSELVKIQVNESVFGPMRAPLLKLRGRYRWRTIIKSAPGEPLTDCLTILSDTFRKARGKQSVEMSVDINPVSMI